MAYAATVLRICRVSAVVITISFYSYKGGVGRSLAITNLAVYLVQFGVTVVMVDFDLEAPGLQYKIQPGSKPIQVSNGGLAGLLAAASTGAALDDLDYDLAVDITQPVESPASAEEDLEQPRGRLLLVPAGDPLQPRYWSDLAEIDWRELFTDEARLGVAVLARLRKHLIDSYNPDLLLVDSRSGITPSAGVSTTLLPDVVVTLLLNTPEHIDGSRIVISAIVGEEGDNIEPPRVVPVLSRYTSSDFAVQLSTVEMRRIGAFAGRDRDALRSDEPIPLETIREALVDGLNDKAASRVASPLVLHADLALQQRECLSFGRYAGGGAGDTTGTLLDDYLRLFANLVPRELVTRHLAGVRNRVRAIILDRPDDAVRTLENLAGLVGDENVFIDLIKIYVLRRDVGSMLRAAERLYRVHASIVVDPAISRAMRELLVDRRSHSRVEPLGLPADFLEAYWRRAAPVDLEWGASVVRAIADSPDARHAAELSEELISSTGTAEVLSEFIRVLAGGNEGAERLAARLAERYFDIGEASVEFLRSAALACKYRPSLELATRLVQSAGFSAVQDSLAVEVLQAAGRYEEAGAVLVEILASTDGNDASVERFASTWGALVARNRELRAELQQRNPRVVELLDSWRDEHFRPSEIRRRVGR
jgi:CobQ/CobB/MinD/ParA nucleotide binding domain